MNKNYLKKIYKYDDTKKCYLIEISLDYYLELFNDWDAAHIKRKELHPELVEYLETVAEDIPLKEKLEIVFVMPDTVKNTDTEQISKQVFNNYFNFMIHLNQRNLRKMLKQAIYYIITGFTFVTLGYLLQKYQALSIEIFSEGLFIGGWVFMWEAISLLFFKSGSIRRINKAYLRFIESEITYQYIKKQPK